MNDTRNDTRKHTRAILRIVKGLYDILATYCLVWVLLFAAVAGALHLGTIALATTPLYDLLTAAGGHLARLLGLDPLWLRIATFGALHVLIFHALPTPRAVFFAAAERGFDALLALYHRTAGRFRPTAVLASTAFTLTVTLLLVPFVVQPTLVAGFDARSMAERVANLLDGTATASVHDSVVGFYRRLHAEPVLDRALAPDDAAAAIAGHAGPVRPPAPLDGSARAMMDRWDPLIREEVGGDPRRFAMLKAFMWVESGGQQFAVSPTGCSGLMQFCAGTARSAPYREVFGTGQVYACRCDGPCRIPAPTRRHLEAGQLDAIHSRSPEFPCELTDARFHPARSIRAGHLYIDRLDRAYGGNLHLMYIGYNSGPAVADAVWRALGRRPDADLTAIAPHLPAALRPHYGARADARARALIDTHLPRLHRAYQRYLPTP